MSTVSDQREHYEKELARLQDLVKQKDLQVGELQSILLDEKKKNDELLQFSGDCAQKIHDLLNHSQSFLLCVWTPCVDHREKLWIAKPERNPVCCHEWVSGNGLSVAFARCLKCNEVNA